MAASCSSKTLNRLSPKIIIIGAGISGISAAEHLIKKGFDNVLLLEAADKIGGRIQTREIGEGWVEEGAQWIHGEDDNAVYDYATKHGLLSDKHGSYELNDELFHTQDGGTIEPLLCAHMCEVLSCKLERKDVSQLTEKYDIDRTTVDRYLEVELREELARSGSEEEGVLKKALFEWFKRFQCSVEGCDALSELSLRSFAHYAECEGNPLTNLKRGYTSFVESVARGIPKANVLLHKTVDRVRIAGEGRHAVDVSCRDGSRYEADHVVVTVSLGVLKWNADKMFEPPLPAAKRDAIKKVGFGTVDKIFLEFEKPFWTQGGPGYSLVWTDDDEKDWSRAIFGFYTVPFATNVLCGWITGKEARQMESLSDVEVEETCIRLLKKFTGRAELPKVKNILRSEWYSNPFTKGSYSYLKSELPDPKLANEVLAEPIYVTKDKKQCPVILFAGEATHPYYFSTVHGAMETGIREATRITDFHSTTPNPKL